MFDLYTFLRLFFIITGSLHSLVFRFTARSRIKFLIQKWTTTTKIIRSVSTGDESFQSVKSLLGSFYGGHITSSSSTSWAVLQASVCSPCLLWWSTETSANRGSATGSLPARIHLVPSGSQICWTTCCSFCGPCCLTVHFYAMETRLFFSLVNQPLLASDFPSAACRTSLVFIELKRVRASLWYRLWLKGMLWLVCSSVQTTTTFCTSLITFFSLSYHLGVRWSSTFHFPSRPFPLHSQFG